MVSDQLVACSLAYFFLLVFGVLRSQEHIRIAAFHAVRRIHWLEVTAHIVHIVFFFGRKHVSPKYLDIYVTFFGVV